MDFFGMPTLIELPTLRENCELAHELGLQFVEINMNPPQFQPEQLDPEEIRALAKEFNLEFTAHLDETLAPADFNTRAAKAYRECAVACIEVAKKAGITILNMHMAEGIHFTLPDKIVYLYDMYRDAYFEGMALFRKECEEAAKGSNVRIVVENVTGFSEVTQQAVDFLLESPIFDLTIDVGHCAATGGVDVPFLTARQNRIIHMHLHDVDGKKDHKALGDGKMPLDRVFKFMNRQCKRVLIEVKTAEGLRRSVKYLQEHGEMPL